MCVGVFQQRAEFAAAKKISVGFKPGMLDGLKGKSVREEVVEHTWLMMTNDYKCIDQ